MAAAARVLPHTPSTPLDLALAKLAKSEPLSSDEAALVKASLAPAVVASTESFFGVALEDLLVDSGIEWERERAFLLGETALDPWLASS